MKRKKQKSKENLHLLFLAFRSTKSVILSALLLQIPLYLHKLFSKWRLLYQSVFFFFFCPLSFLKSKVYMLNLSPSELRLIQCYFSIISDWVLVLWRYSLGKRVLISWTSENPGGCLPPFIFFEYVFKSCNWVSSSFFEF